MFENAEDYKRCSRCQQVKPKIDFSKSRRKLDGLQSRCKECDREIKQNVQQQPKEHVAQKRCRLCKEVKARESFSKDLAKRDGLGSYCKECRRLKRETSKKLDRTLPEVKRCARCGQEKKQQEFYGSKYHHDGLRNECKDCVRLDRRVYCAVRKAQKEQKGFHGPGIDTWEQVGAMLREMAELQIGVNREKQQHVKTVNVLKRDFANKLRPYLIKQSRFQLMIEYFIKTHRRECKRLHRQFRFGSVSFSRNTIDVQLNVAFAQERLGLP